MIVVDASVFVGFLAFADHRGRKPRLVLGRDPQWVAPEHWKAEVFSAIRGLALGGKIAANRAEWALERLPRLNVTSASIDRLLPRMWELRANFTGYDAAYVALAEADGLTLATRDARLAKEAVKHCRVELIT